MIPDHERLERIDEFRVWAKARIRECQRQELKFGVNWAKKGPPQALVEAWAERRALQAALKILTGALAVLFFVGCQPARSEALCLRLTQCGLAPPSGCVAATSKLANSVPPACYSCMERMSCSEWNDFVTGGNPCDAKC